MSYNKESLENLEETPTKKILTATERAEIEGLFKLCGEVGDYVVNHDSEGFLSSIVQNMGGGVTKTTTMNRTGDLVLSIQVHFSDNSYNRTYTFNRSAEGIVESVIIS
jgi:hypothetical protein